MWAPGRLNRTDSIQSVSRGLSSNRSSTYEENKGNMWIPPKESPTPNRLSRTASVQSIQSLASSRGSIYGDGIVEKSPPPRYETWQPPARSEPAVQDIRLGRRESISSDNSHSTLAEDPAEHEMEAKTPTIVRKTLDHPPVRHEAPKSRQAAPAAKPAAPAGPLEQQLLTLLSKVKLIEQDQPTVMAEEYKELEQRVKALEAEKKTWQKRHEDLFALRDEDLANLIKVRDMLARERRLHDGLKKLRDDDLNNVLELRAKLAQFNWSKPKTPELTNRSSFRQSMREGTDLWQAAKTAAMEQRLLELEQANAKLKKQLNEGAGGTATAQPLVTGGAELGIKIEDFIEDTARHRERSAAKVQQLRSENESLRKDLARMEDKNAELEDKIHRLRRV